MNESKEVRITIRLSIEENEWLEKSAKEQGMSLSRYIRYRALEDREEGQENQQPYYAEFLNKNLPLLTRVLFDTYYHTRALARISLDDETFKEIEEQNAIDFKNLKIEKPKNADTTD